MSRQVTHFLRKPGPSTFSIERVYRDVRSALPASWSAQTWTCRHASTGLWRRLRDAWAARKAQTAVNHVTGDVHYLTLFLRRRQTVLTIHDLVSLQRLHGIKRWLLWLFWYWLPVHRSRAVVVISQATRDALLASVRCDPDKIHVIHNPVSPEFQPVPRRFNTQCPRILQIGTKPNKNIQRVAAALEGIDCVLVVIGCLRSEDAEALRAHRIDVENHTRLTSNQLLAQYQHADMLLFASTYEGFGLPIVEANAVGRPVVASNIAPMPEVAGDAACLVDPWQPTSIRDGVRRILQDAKYRRKLVERGHNNAKRFHAAAIARRHAALYDHVAGPEKR